MFALSRTLRERTTRQLKLDKALGNDPTSLRIQTHGTCSVFYDLELTLVWVKEILVEKRGDLLGVFWESVSKEIAQHRGKSILRRSQPYTPPPPYCKRSDPE